MMKIFSRCSRTIACLMLPFLLLLPFGRTEESASADPRTPSAVEAPSLPDAAQAFHRCSRFMLERPNFTITTSGSAVTKKAWITYTQKISNQWFKYGDACFTRSTSSSVLVKMSHQALIVKDRAGSVAFRDASEGPIATTTGADYRMTYAFLPDEPQVGGFVVNRDTVQSFSSKSEEENLLFTAELIPDSYEGTHAMRRQMKRFGGLKSLPDFSSVTLSLLTASDLTPLRLIAETAYEIEIAVLGKTKCTQRLVSYFSDVTAADLPDLSPFYDALSPSLS